MLMSRSLQRLSLLAGVSALILRVPVPGQSLELAAVFWERGLFMVGSTCLTPSSLPLVRSLPGLPALCSGPAGSRGLGKVVTLISPSLQMGENEAREVWSCFLVASKFNTFTHQPGHPLSLG